MVGVKKKPRKQFLEHLKTNLNLNSKRINVQLGKFKKNIAAIS